MYLMCRWASVSRSGYYRWRNQGLSETQKRREELTILITHFFHESDQTYGYRRIHAALAERGVHASPELVRQLMHQAGLVACQPRKRARTTIPAQDLHHRPDLVKRNFTANKPGQKWVGDITYIPTWEGFTYLATVMDCYSKKIIGYAIAGNMRTQLIAEALHMAVRNCPVTRGETIFHSDRGSQYTSADYAEVMNTYGIRASVGRTGSCYDNAAAESFNATCKKEVVNRKIYPTRKHAIKDVTAWIELRYNHKTTPLSARVPNPQPRPPTMEPKPESSLEIPFFNSVHKTHSTPKVS